MNTRLADHRAYLADARRLTAYERAIRAVVRPGSVVADVGSGTGILGLMACRAGARRVYAIEPSGIASTARAIARLNGVADRITVIESSSAQAALPEPCDVAVSDFIGHLGFDAGVFSIARDISRLLKPGGVSIPAALTLAVAPAECAAVCDEVAFWSAPVAGFDMTPASALAANTPFTEFTDARELLSDDAVEGTFDLLAAADLLRIGGSVRARREGVLRGLAGWFRARLAPAVEITNAPAAQDRIARRNMVLPLAEPIAVARGDEVSMQLAVRPHDLIVSWRVAAGGRELRHSSFQGLLIRRGQ